MTRRTSLAVAVLLGLAMGVLSSQPASAAPSCIAESVAAEHEALGTAWGTDLIAYLATHPEVLNESGFLSFGDLASYGASQPHDACPEDL